MLRRSLAAAAVGVGALVAGSTAGLAPATAAAPAVQSHTPRAKGFPAGSLAALADGVRLRVGAAINTDLLGTDATYTALAGSEFSTVTPENSMKWEVVEPQQGTYDWSGGDKLVAFAQAHNQLVRGHNLVWHSQLPKWLTPDGVTTTFTNDQVKAILKKHVIDEATHFKGKIWQWDVVNEAFNDDGTPRQDIWYKAWGGLGYIADAFRWAHQADSKALLFYNDYNIEYTGPKSNAEYAFIKGLKQSGVPIDGVGFQTHLDTQYGFPDLKNNLQRFADLGLKVAETEVDVRTFTKPAPDVNVPASGLAQAAQEAYWMKTLQACLAVRPCISYTAWGISDKNSWVPGVFAGEGAALLWDEGYQPKPQFTDLQDLLALSQDGRRHG